MSEFNPETLKQLYIPPSSSHKGQNGKVMVIGGSKLFHAASLWALEVASHIVDMVYYASTAENNEIVHQAKDQFRNGIVVPRNKIDSYIEEADSILIGPGLPRIEGQETGDDDTKKLTERLLTSYPHKRWVIDGGSLQVMDPHLIPPHAILTPHPKEFEKIFGLRDANENSVQQLEQTATHVQEQSKRYNCIIALKGQTDIVASGDNIITISGGNAGMTKGGTGDVLAGLATALYAKNDAFLAAEAASYINKRAGEKLFETQGYWYNTSDLVHIIPVVLKELIG